MVHKPEESILDFVETFWDAFIVPTLVDYIKIPCLSIDFDPQWRSHPYMEDVRSLALQWLEHQAEADWTVHAETLPNKTPLILVEIPPAGDPANTETVLLYGHLDKQPEMEGWREGFGPWIPIIEQGRLYGRGGADDGYALFAAVAVVKALRRLKRSHARIVILIEFSEESGSPHLPDYLHHYESVIGVPALVIALDSGTGDYERLWSTTSLRGMLACNVTVEVLKEATHSGIASGIVPCSMRIMRELLERLEDTRTGEVLLTELHGPIPEARLHQAQQTAALIGNDALGGFSSIDGLEPVSDDPVQRLLNNTWKPTVCVVGQDGIPAVKDAGNVLRAYTRFKLSFRLPPNVTVETAKTAIEQQLSRDSPYSARVSVEFDQGGKGWDAPELAPWLQQANSEASTLFYGQDAAYTGLGASIPFMSMLGESYPEAQFLITGVLGPKSNAHGPNEFLHIPYAKKLTACVVHILDQHSRQTSG
ncbi:MAG: M20/M25/M40 family metallo-hydrolase [Gammaproteobacteria bacterium]|nr:M20/M25/M40 family metallo-hydrolase [Gammaproteobacteria bacterium]MDH5801206.1 M20/M25/M40 family metallo-hydrolase [Gammaproteobacteria bacterium]